MIIGYDAKRFFHNTSGLGNYSRTLIDNLSKHFPDDTFRLFVTNPHGQPKVENLIQRSNVEVITPKNKFLWRSSGMTKQFDGLDVYHGLSHELPQGIASTRVKSVVTICDLIYHHFPKDFPWIDRKIYQYKCRYACQQADHIVTISKSTERDVRNVFDVEGAKVSVIYPSVDLLFDRLPKHDFIQSVRHKYELPDQYILYSGGLLTRKNLFNVLRAFSQIPDADKVPLILLVSGVDRSGQVQSWIAENNIVESTINLGYVALEDLPTLYHEAMFTLYPSKYEGFGLPIVESLKMNTPVITTKVSSMPEAAEQGALYADPDSIADLTQKMTTLLRDQELRKTLADLGQNHLNNFEGFSSAKKLMNLYRNLVA
ncbi:MAG: glycosyltransferase family 4 protein [Saprospiraceae bacterium]|nr:glycosyltransferase family 4 protein [Saprospiraceae bacterium]